MGSSSGVPANWNSVDTHNLIASDDPRNDPALDDMRAVFEQ